MFENEPLLLTKLLQPHKLLPLIQYKQLLHGFVEILARKAFKLAVTVSSSSTSNNLIDSDMQTFCASSWFFLVSIKQTDLKYPSSSLRSLWKVQVFGGEMMLGGGKA
jgi:hypothetical protein